MATKRPNAKVVEKVRGKLESKGLLTAAAIQELRDNLKKKREEAKFYDLAKKRELDETISALNHLLDTI
ncbi:hypothetical protein [Allomuricauda sp. d1]|uniref:hypothetical protein n=1 Tax=Allomuricauda sp. d1 TaxID=3136725 RepID=UPI0031D390EE